MKCPKCSCEQSVKCGKDRKGQQRFRCEGCRKTFVEPHALAGKKTSLDDAAKILSMLLEGMSVRACSRISGMTPKAILSIVVQAGESCAKFMESQIRNIPVSVCEIDELWAFFHCKRKTAERNGYSPEVGGDRYTFCAIDRDSKLLLCWHNGPRDATEAWRFADKLYLAVDGSPTICSDGFTPYYSAIALTFRHEVNHGMIIKHFQSSVARDAQARYSPGSITGVEKKVVCGDVTESEIGTSRIERQNLSIRMHNRRLTRLTNAHSKTARNHDAMTGLYFAWANWCRKHSTIKTTPAVKAGLTDRQWTIAELLMAAAAA